MHSPPSWSIDGIIVHGQGCCCIPPAFKVAFITVLASSSLFSQMWLKVCTSQNELLEENLFNAEASATGPERFQPRSLCGGLEFEEDSLQCTAADAEHSREEGHCRSVPTGM